MMLMLREMRSLRGCGSLWRHRDAGWTPARRGLSVLGHADRSEAGVGASRTGLTGCGEAGVGGWRTGLTGRGEAGLRGWRTGGLTGRGEAGLGASRTGVTGRGEAGLGGWRTGVVGFSSRRYTTVRRDAVDKNRRTDSYTSIVDPDREETFVFLDHVEEDDHPPGPDTTTPYPPTSPRTMMDGPDTTTPYPPTSPRTMVDGPRTTTTTLYPPTSPRTMVDGPDTTTPYPPTSPRTMMDGPDTTTLYPPNNPTSPRTMVDGPDTTTTTTTLMHGLPGQGTSEKHHRTLQTQLRSLRVQTEGPGEPSSIQFTDIDFPLDQDMLKSTKKRKKALKALRGEHKVFGSADASEPPSETVCSGCGAVLHCSDAQTAGFMPAEKFKPLVRGHGGGGGGLGGAVCQRCYLLTHHQKALSIKMSAQDYRKVVGGIKARAALVLLIVDLLDLPDSVVPDLPGLVGQNKRLVVLGNKVDLLPGDAPNYLGRVRRQLSLYCSRAGLGDDLKDVHLISAKTGYGVEELISSLQRSWKYKGDVFLVGTANAGKSTLFNILLDSDYCKSKGSELIHKATISPWPGTTLDLLKFPIINPTPSRMLRRQERLQTSSSQTEGDLSPEELRRLQRLSKQGYLVGRVGRTFGVPPSRQVIDFDPDSLAYSEEDSGDHRIPDSRAPAVEFTHNELKDAHWLYDTPGIMKENDLLSLLTEEEVKMVVPTKAIVPRTFVMKPGMTLFLGGVGRVDYIQGEHPLWLSVVVSNLLPLHVTVLERAEEVYDKHAGRSALLGVPMGGEQRMRTFPPLVWEEFTLEGQGHMTASADLTMSSLGWVAVTGVEGARMVLRAHVPRGAGLGLRTPPLLPHVVGLKGERLRRSAAYKTAKPPALVNTTLSHHGATRLTVQKKKKRKEKEKKK